MRQTHLAVCTPLISLSLDRLLDLITLLLAAARCHLAGLIDTLGRSLDFPEPHGARHFGTAAHFD